MSAVSAFVNIEDGYTLDGRINAEPGLYPGMTFQYRPATWTERAQCRGLVGEHEKQGKFVDKMLSEKIVAWNFAEPIGLEYVQRLRVSLKSRVLDIILEYVASDTAEADAKN